jgi:hypothetical protein
MTCSSVLVAEDCMDAAAGESFGINLASNVYDSRRRLAVLSDVL